VAVGKGGGGEGGERLAAGARRRATEKRMDWGDELESPGRFVGFVSCWAFFGCWGWAAAGDRPRGKARARDSDARAFPLPYFPWLQLDSFVGLVSDGPIN